MGIFDQLPETESIAIDIYPGKILKNRFLEPANISAYKLAQETGLSATRISQILNNKRSISAETALKLGKVLKTTPQFWMNLQSNYDLRSAENKFHDDVEKLHAIY